MGEWVDLPRSRHGRDGSFEKEMEIGSADAVPCEFDFDRTGSELRFRYLVDSYILCSVVSQSLHVAYSPIRH